MSRFTGVCTRRTWCTRYTGRGMHINVFWKLNKKFPPPRVHKELGEYEIGRSRLAKTCFQVTASGWVSFLLHPLPSARVWAPLGGWPRKLVP